MEGETEATVNLGARSLLTQAVNLAAGRDLEDASEWDGLFLSVVTRTQGSRPVTLSDVATCLAAQSCQDFEWIVVVNNASEDAIRSVEQTIQKAVPSLLSRTRLVICRGETGRTPPLNLGWEHARGRYVAALDDDDLIFDHWVEEFYRLAKLEDGKVLRAVVARQPFEWINTPEGACGRAIGTIELHYPADFDLFLHLKQNASPFIGLAYPRAAFVQLGIRFSEEYRVNEDWDFLIRNAAVCGVACSPEVTSLYRFWQSGDSSRAAHQESIFREDEARMKERWELLILLVQGHSKKLEQLAEVPPPVESDRAKELLHHIRAILESGSWKKTAPLRMFSSWQPPSNLDRLSVDELEKIHQMLLDSPSWKLSRLIRKA